MFQYLNAPFLLDLMFPFLKGRNGERELSLQSKMLLNFGCVYKFFFTRGELGEFSLKRLSGVAVDIGIE